MNQNKPKTMIQEKITNALIGGSGVGASLLVDSASVPDVTDVQGVVSVIVQIIIGVTTLWGLFRKKRV